MIISHPAKNGYQEKLLVDHLAEVASDAKEMIQKLSLNLTTTTKDKLTFVAEKIGIMHDLGKASSYFQNYVRGGNRNNLILFSISILGKNILLLLLMLLNVCKNIIVT